MNTPTDFNVTVHYARLSVGCTYQGARFHIWTDRELNPESPTVYKNPLDASLRPSDPGYFRTRHLSRHFGQGKIVAAAMLAAAPALLSEAFKKTEAKAAVEEAERQATIARNAAREAGPQLLAALQRVEQWDAAGLALTEDIMADVRAAIAAATPAQH